MALVMFSALDTTSVEWGMKNSTFWKHSADTHIVLMPAYRQKVPNGYAN